MKKSTSPAPSEMLTPAEQAQQYKEFKRDLFRVFMDQVPGMRKQIQERYPDFDDRQVDDFIERVRQDWFKQAKETLKTKLLRNDSAPSSPSP